MLHVVRHLNKTQSAPIVFRCNLVRYYNIIIISILPAVWPQKNHTYCMSWRILNLSKSNVVIFGKTE